MAPPQNAPRPPASEPPRARPSLLLPQRLGLVVAALDLILALFVNSPLGSALWGGPVERMALYWVVLAANVGSVLCAIGLALRNPGLAWGGAGAFLALAFLMPQFWYAVLPALALVACVLAWEMVRPRPPPPAPVHAWQGFPCPPPPPAWR